MVTPGHLRRRQSSSSGDHARIRSFSSKGVAPAEAGAADGRVVLEEMVKGPMYSDERLTGKDDVSVLTR